MTINIAPEMYLTEIQAAFHQNFPFLKIGFFSKAHQAGEGSAVASLLSDRNLKVKDVSEKTKGDMHFTFDEKASVSSIEAAFEANFGLHLQVFRKSGNIWLQTSSTDTLSLAEQTLKAKEAEWRQAPIAEPMDYREQD